MTHKEDRRGDALALPSPTDDLFSEAGGCRQSRGYVWFPTFFL
jgi:hypothetical protein